MLFVLSACFRGFYSLGKVVDPLFSFFYRYLMKSERRMEHMIHFSGPGLVRRGRAEERKGLTYAPWTDRLVVGEFGWM